MRIDGKSLCRADVDKVNTVINKHWDSLESAFLESRRDNIDSMFGPESIEVLVGGEVWEVSDRLEPNATFFFEDSVMWVSCRELFEICLKLRE